MTTDERRVEVGEHIGVHRAEGGPRPMLHADGEGLQNLVFEVGPRMGGGHGRQCFGREVVTADAEYVGLDTGGDQRYFRLEKFGHTGCRMQSDAEPNSSIPRWRRKSRAALAPSTSNRRLEEVR